MILWVLFLLILAIEHHFYKMETSVWDALVMILSYLIIQEIETK